MKYFEKVIEPIKNELNEFNNNLENYLHSNSKSINNITNYILKHKGKQLRPILVFLSAKLLGEVNKSTYIGAALLEFIHTATLIHDDVVDDAHIRRNNFSINSLWRNKAAVLYGDYLLAKSLLLCVKNSCFHFLEIISEVVKDMSEGELIQLDKIKKNDISYDTYYNIISKKTASLFSACTYIGAITNTNKPEILSDFKQLGYNLGMAFQIKDDLNDLIPFNETDKPKFNDIKENYYTLPILYVLNNNNYYEKLKIKKLLIDFLKNKKSQQDIYSYLKEKNAIEFTKKTIKFYIEKCKLILKNYPESSEKQSFYLILDYISDF